MSTLDDIRAAERDRDDADARNRAAIERVRVAEASLRDAVEEREAARLWLRAERDRLTRLTTQRHAELFEERQALIPPDEGRTP